MAAKRTGPRCRTIGGVVYDLHPSTRQPPCARRRASSGPSSSAPSASAPAISDVLLTVEHAPAGDGYDLIASSRSGSAGVAKVLGSFPTRDEAKAARAVAEKTGSPPKPPPAPKREPGAWERGKFARARRSGVVSNDLRVLEREEREREHIERERARFAEREAEKTTLAAVGRLPKRAKQAAAASTALLERRELKSLERAALKTVEKYNAGGLLYTSPGGELGAMLHDLAQRGHVKAYAHDRFYLPEYSGELARLTRNRPAPPKPPKPIVPTPKPAPPKRAKTATPAPPAAFVDVASERSVSDYDLRRQKVVPLPRSIDTSKVAVGDRVSVFSYSENEPSHGVLVELPSEHGKKEPTVRFEHGGIFGVDGMRRSIRWERIFAGWLDPNVNWKPWKG